MIGDYIKDPSCGLGKVIKLRPGNELVYFFKANDSLHAGAIEPGSVQTTMVGGLALTTLK